MGRSAVLELMRPVVAEILEAKHSTPMTGKEEGCRYRTTSL